MGFIEKGDGTGILLEEPNPTGSRPRDLIGLYRQQKKPHPANTEASKATRRRQRATRRRQRKEGRTKDGKGESEEATKQPREPGGIKIPRSDI